MASIIYNSQRRENSYLEGNIISLTMGKDSNNAVKTTKENPNLNKMRYGLEIHNILHHIPNIGYLLGVV